MDLLSSFIFAVGSVICHQRPERSFFFDGHQLPVCARCTGLYLSGLAGFAAWLVWRRMAVLVPGTNSASEAVSVPGTNSAGKAVSVPGTNSAVDPKVAGRLLAIAAMPTALSLLTAAIGVWDGSNFTRALLAIPLGASAGAIVAAVATKDLR